jgi:hypothetical protein
MNWRSYDRQTRKEILSSSDMVKKSRVLDEGTSFERKALAHEVLSRRTCVGVSIIRISRRIPKP